MFINMFGYIVFVVIVEIVFVVVTHIVKKVYGNNLKLPNIFLIMFQENLIPYTNDLYTFLGYKRMLSRFNLVSLLEIVVDVR